MFTCLFSFFEPPAVPGRLPFRKILVSVKFVSAIRGPEKWLRQFYGRLEKCVLSAGKPVSVKFVLGGGGILGLGGGVPILFFRGPKTLKYQKKHRVYANFFEKFV